MFRNLKRFLLSPSQDRESRGRDEEAIRFLEQLIKSVHDDFPFLSSVYGFEVVHEEYVSRGACFLALENTLMRLRVASGGELGGYGWSVGDKDAELVFEKGRGWVNLLRFVNDRFGANETLPETGLPSWEPIPTDLLRDTYARVLVARMPEIMRMFETFERVSQMPEHSEN